MNTTIAVQCRGVLKHYPVYADPLDLLLSRFGMKGLADWRRGKPLKVFEALRGVDLDIYRGERVGIIGANGAGKTTLLKLITGAVTGNMVPDGGLITVRGRVEALMHSAVSFQPELTGRANISSSLTYNGLHGARLKAAIDDVINFAQLGLFIDQPVMTYSLGMNARLQFAVATAIEPDILIVDEVLGAGDSYFAAKSAERMKKLTNSGCTLLLVTHSKQQMQQFCERVVWLEHGSVVADGPVSKVLNLYLDRNTVEENEVEFTKAVWHSFQPDVPQELRSPFVRQSLAEAEGEPADAGAWVELPSGLTGRRLPYSGTEKISDVRVEAFTTTHDRLFVGLDNRVRVVVDVSSFASDIVCVLELFSLSGSRVTRIEGVVEECGDGSGKATIELDKMVLGARDYVGTLSLRGCGGDGCSVTLDKLSQVVYLPVSNVSDSDPPLLHYPASWRFADGPWCPSRISSAQ